MRTPEGWAKAETSTPEATVNGWTNYATWNVVLWIDNDEAAYRINRYWLRRLHTMTPEVAAEVALDCLGAPITPDIDASDWATVNWSEVAEHWQEEIDELDVDEL